MFDTIILLTGPVEQGPLTALLRQHNPHIDVRWAQTLADLDAMTPEMLRRARLIAFVTSVIVPKRVLDALGHGAYNFHPGPPDYPGWLPSHFAVHDRVSCFGVTAHRMIEQVDAGPIVGVELFDVPANVGVVELEHRTFAELARLFWKLGAMLATREDALAELPIRWGERRGTRRGFAAACAIPLDIGKEDLDRRLAAFGIGGFGVSPTVTLHGHRFRYVPPETSAVAEAPATMPTQAVA